MNITCLNEEYGIDTQKSNTVKLQLSESIGTGPYSDNQKFG